MRKYSNILIDKWLKQEESFINAQYEAQPERIPKEYDSKLEALNALEQNKEIALNKAKIDHGRKYLVAGEIVDVLIQTIAFVKFGHGETASIATYDYDEKIYDYNFNVLKEYIVKLNNSVTESLTNTIVMTLTARSSELAIFNPLPKYKIAVGNGIYNTITKELEEFSPKYTVLNRISTNYNPNVEHPIFEDGFTFQNMIQTFSNNNSDRILLLYQIMKSIITGVSFSDAFFIFLGEGGDGKSTFFNLIINIIGRHNVGFVNFSELSKEDKFLETMNKKLVIGLDNNANVFIRDMAKLKSIASHETVTYTRKFKTAISVPFTATFIQLCNTMPRFSESGNSLMRRIVMFLAEYSYTKHGSENPNIESYINNQQFKEYVLKLIIDFPYYSNFNDVDRKVSKQSLDNDDSILQVIEDFVTTGLLVKNEKVPMHYLYGAYLDWMNNYNFSANKLGLKGYMSKIESYLLKIGYRISKSNDRARPSTLINLQDFNESTLLAYKDGKFLSDAITKDTQFRYVYKDPELEIESLSKTIRRNDNEISAIEYFKLHQSLYEFAKENNLLNHIEIINNEVKKENDNEDFDLNRINFNNIESISDINKIINSDFNIDDILTILELYILEHKDPTLMLEFKTINGDQQKVINILNKIKSDLEEKQVKIEGESH